MKVFDALRHMNVVSNLSRLVGRCQFHGLIGNSELRMHTHHSGDHITVVRQRVFDKGRILHYCFPGLIHAVTV